MPASKQSRLAADPAYALEGLEAISRREPPLRAWLRRRRAALLRFCTYAGARELWSALHSVLFLVAASLVFGRIPELPVAILVLIPFVYLSALGALLLLAGLARGRVFGRFSRCLGRRLFGQEDFLSAAARGAGLRLLRTAFGVGVYLLFGLVYLALGPDDDPLGWLLLPCLLAGMAAIYSLGRQAELTIEEREAENEPAVPVVPFVRAFRRNLARRIIYVVFLVASLYLMSHYLFSGL
jgi:hypothetical protein